MNIHVHVVLWNEEAILPWFLQHYSQFATRIFCHDNGSTDASRDIVLRCPITELVDFDSGGELRDDLNAKIKNEAWKHRNADWVICVDADEFLCSPIIPMVQMCERLRNLAISVPTTKGYQMYSSTFPQCSGKAFLTDLVTSGIEDTFYSKRCLFDAQAIEDINYSAGAHSCNPREKSEKLREHNDSAIGPLYLLHYKYAIGLNALLARYRLINSRISEQNRRNGWGSQYWDETFTTNRFREIAANARQIQFLHGNI